MESDGCFAAIKSHDNDKIAREERREGGLQSLSEFEGFAPVFDMDMVDEAFVSGLILSCRAVRSGIAFF